MIKLQETGKLAVNSLLDIFYPRLCNACNNVLHLHENHLCFYCYHKLPYTNFHYLSPNPVEKMFWGRFPVNKGTAFLYFSKAGRVQQIIHNVKYRHQWELGYYMGELFAENIKTGDFLSDIDLIVPIPLSQTKIKKRGYNQSTCFGKGLSHQAGLTLNDTNLIRTQDTASQTLKGRFNRWENVNEIFTIKDPKAFENSHVLLFDDVITTGATLEAAAWTLNTVNNVTVSIATIGIASKLP